MDIEKGNNYPLAYQCCTREELENEAIYLRKWIDWYNDRLEIVKVLIMRMEKDKGEIK